LETFKQECTKRNSNDIRNKKVFFTKILSNTNVGIEFYKPPKYLYSLFSENDNLRTNFNTIVNSNIQLNKIFLEICIPKLFTSDEIELKPKELNMGDTTIINNKSFISKPNSPVSNRYLLGMNDFTQLRKGSMNVNYSFMTNNKEHIGSPHSLQHTNSIGSPTSSQLCSPRSDMMIRSPHSTHTGYTPHTPTISGIPHSHPFNNLNKLLLNQRKFSTDYHDKKHQTLSSPHLMKMNVGYDNNGFISPRGYHVNYKPIYSKLSFNENNTYSESFYKHYEGMNNFTIMKNAVTPFITHSSESQVI
jgi:hypothetical protein